MRFSGTFLLRYLQSTDSLREGIIHDTNEKGYYAFFDPANFEGADDGIFTSEELGISHLGDLPATTETLESLFYGTGINFLRSIDFVELLDFFIFIGSNPDLLWNDSFLEEADSLIVEILRDPAEEPYFNTAEVALFLFERAIEGIDLIGVETGYYLFQDTLV